MYPPTKSTFKGANDYDKQNYFNKEKEKQINT